MTQKKSDDSRRPYQPPGISDEKEFERQALQACDKEPARGECNSVFPPTTPNVS